MVTHPEPDTSALKTHVEQAWNDRTLLQADDESHRRAVRQTVAHVDAGQLRVASPPETEGGDWTVNAWVKQAIVLYFVLQEMRTDQVGPFEYHDKIPLKRDWALQGVRVVPPATARYGCFIESGCILMPSYVNIGAYIGSGTMVDTWATVGSCAQIGKDVHLSGGVGIGGVLEPPGARPVIIEDGCFLGSRSIVVEGVHLEREVVLGANVVITASTPIIDVTGPEPLTHKGKVPARSVVIPGTRKKQFPAGEYELACALLIGRRRESTDLRTSLNDALRTFGVSV